MVRWSVELAIGSVGGCRINIRRCWRHTTSRSAPRELWRFSSHIGSCIAKVRPPATGRASAFGFGSQPVSGGSPLCDTLVAKRKPASAVSGAQCDRQLRAGASQPNAPRLASSTDADSVRCGSRVSAVGMRGRGREQVSALVSQRAAIFGATWCAISSSCCCSSSSGQR
jgi:hypothetical protein